MKDFFEKLLRSLNVIEVRGKDNMEVMLGCISAVEGVILQLSNPPEGEETEETNGG